MPFLHSNIRFIWASFGCLFFLLWISSCKKEETAPQNTEAPVSVLPSGIVSSYDALFAVFQTKNKGQKGYSTAAPNSFAYYSSKTIYNEAYSAADLISMGEVRLNGIRFRNKSSVQNYYNDSTSQFFNSPHNWKVEGTAQVDSFYYSNTETGPVFLGETDLPDSLRIAQGLNFTLKKLSHYDLAYVFLMGNSGSTVYPSKLLVAGDSIVYFSPEQLNGLVPGDQCYFNIQFYKDRPRQINGKKIVFREGLSYTNFSFKIKK